MELDYLNALWMKHENMLDGVGRFEHSLDETWTHVELHNMDEIVLCQLEHIWIKMMNWMNFDVYETFHMDEV